MSARTTAAAAVTAAVLPSRKEARRCPAVTLPASSRH